MFVAADEANVMVYTTMLLETINAAREPTSLETNSKSALEQRPSGQGLDFGFARKSSDVDARKGFWKEAVKLLGA